ncbi:MAG TPA: WecB/TagA/CpsF family glycosyltransferase [Anaerolineales bacterium]|nr:WecB/TagA/CpsF family glycosyltransferase [Anaerolineales bacterium]
MSPPGRNANSVSESLPLLASEDRANILGLGVSRLNLRLAVDTVERWIDRGERHYVCVAAVHTVMACRRDPGLLKVCNRSGMTTPDGMPLVWLARRSGHPSVERVYGPDLLMALCDPAAAPRRRHYFFGGGPGVAGRLVDRLQTLFPALQIAGWLSPSYGPRLLEQDESSTAAINDRAPDIVWVGLGTGTQEHWMARNRPSLQAPVLIGVGAAFDFLSGVKPQAPRWMQRSGLEWLFRLMSEPRRLGPRYGQYPLFLLLLAGQQLGLRRYPMET